MSFLLEKSCSICSHCKKLNKTITVIVVIISNFDFGVQCCIVEIVKL